MERFEVLLAAAEGEVKDAFDGGGTGRDGDVATFRGAGTTMGDASTEGLAMDAGERVVAVVAEVAAVVAAAVAVLEGEEDDDEEDIEAMAARVAADAAKMACAPEKREKGEPVEGNEEAGDEEEADAEGVEATPVAPAPRG